MKLNGATIENMTIGGKTFNDSYEFIKALKSERNILADVYIEGHLVGVGHVTFSEDSGWLVAGLNVRFSLDTPILVKSIIIKVYEGGHKDTTIMSTATSTVNEYIETGDQDADLHFIVMSVHPYNSWRRPKNNSRISWLRSHLIQPAHLDDLPTQGGDVVVDEPETPTEPFEPISGGDPELDPTDDPIPGEPTDPTEGPVDGEYDDRIITFKLGNGDDDTAYCFSVSNIANRQYTWYFYTAGDAFICSCDGEENSHNLIIPTIDNNYSLLSEYDSVKILLRDGGTQMAPPQTVTMLL